MKGNNIKFYFVLILVVLLTNCGGNFNSHNSSKDLNNIIGIPIIIRDLEIEIAQYDFPDEMSEVDAIRECASLGAGWRLPTFSELYFLYKGKNAFGGFVHDKYWSNSSNKLDEFLVVDFSNGDMQSIYKNTESSISVRAVRSLRSSSPENSVPDSTAKIAAPSSNKEINITIIPAEIIGKTVVYNNLIFAENDFPNKMNWYEAKKACSALGPGWRMFTIEESKQINAIKENPMALKLDFYWTSSEYEEGNEWIKEDLENIDTNKFAELDGKHRKQTEAEYISWLKMREESFNIAFCGNCGFGPQARSWKFYVRAVKDKK